jgi:hypothetical protein
MSHQDTTRVTYGGTGRKGKTTGKGQYIKGNTVVYFTCAQQNVLRSQNVSN